jgi:hypothetical protein
MQNKLPYVIVLLLTVAFACNNKTEGEEKEEKAPEKEVVVDADDPETKHILEVLSTDTINEVAWDNIRFGKFSKEKLPLYEKEIGGLTFNPSGLFVDENLLYVSLVSNTGYATKGEIGEENAAFDAAEYNKQLMGVVTTCVDRFPGSETNYHAKSHGQLNESMNTDKDLELTLGTFFAGNKKIQVVFTQKIVKEGDTKEIKISTAINIAHEPMMVEFRKLSEPLQQKYWDESAAK